MYTMHLLNDRPFLLVKLSKGSLLHSSFDVPNYNILRILNVFHNITARNKVPKDKKISKIM